MTAVRDERTVLRELEALLVREQEALVAHEGDALFGLAESRERLSAELGEAAARRRAAPRDPALEAELLALYQAMRDRHETQSRVVRRFEDRNGRALGVLAQAAGRGGVYGSDGRMSRQWSAAA